MPKISNDVLDLAIEINVGTAGYLNLGLDESRKRNESKFIEYVKELYFIYLKDVCGVDEEKLGYIYKSKKTLDEAITRHDNSTLITEEKPATRPEIEKTKSLVEIVLKIKPVSFDFRIFIDLLGQGNGMKDSSCLNKKELEKGHEILLELEKDFLKRRKELGLEAPETTFLESIEATKIPNPYCSNPRHLDILLEAMLSKRKAGTWQDYCFGRKDGNYPLEKIIENTRQR